MPATFTLDAVAWRVHDLKKSSAFYESIGFKVVERTPEMLTLAPAGEGVHGRPLLRLLLSPAAPLADGRGAYHVAFNVPQRADLGALLQRLLSARTPLTGFADHLVSEAIYLPDAEGHGLEFTWDRPRAAWQYPGGVLAIGTDPLDVQGVLKAAAGALQALPQASFVGHVHLYAADPMQDARFYMTHFGMQEVVRFGPWGTFLAADGYHHHIGLRRGNGATDAQHDHGLAWIEARLDAALYQALPAPEVGRVKEMMAPSGHVWRVRPMDAAA